jgi:hypothetical protein
LIGKGLYSRLTDEVLNIATQNHRRSNWRKRIESLLGRARRRAMRRGMGFEITTEWVLARLVAQNYQCAKTGIPLQLICPDTNKTYSAFSPSIDRTDSSLGYTPENATVVCYMYNAAKNRFTEENVHRFAEAFLAHNNIVIDNLTEK